MISIRSQSEIFGGRIWLVMEPLLDDDFRPTRAPNHQLLSHGTMICFQAFCVLDIFSNPFFETADCALNLDDIGDDSHDIRGRVYSSAR